MSEARQVYRVGSLDLATLNRTLQQIANRLDQIEGYRGTPTFKANLDLDGHKASNAGTPSQPTDLARKDEVADIGEYTATVATLEARILALEVGKADADDVAAALALKADASHGHASLAFTEGWTVLAQDDGVTVLHGAGDW